MSSLAIKSQNTKSIDKSSMDVLEKIKNNKDFNLNLTESELSTNLKKKDVDNNLLTTYNKLKKIIKYQDHLEKELAEEIDKIKKNTKQQKKMLDSLKKYQKKPKGIGSEDKSLVLTSSTNNKSVVTNKTKPLSKKFNCSKKNSRMILNNKNSKTEIKNTVNSIFSPNNFRDRLMYIPSWSAINNEPGNNEFVSYPQYNNYNNPFAISVDGNYMDHTNPYFHQYVNNSQSRWGNHQNSNCYNNNYSNLMGSPPMHIPNQTPMQYPANNYPIQPNQSNMMNNNRNFQNIPQTFQKPLSNIPANNNSCPAMGCNN